MSRPTRLFALLAVAALTGCGQAVSGEPTVSYAPAPARALEVAAAAPRAHQAVDVTLKLQFPSPAWSYDTTAVEVDDVNRVIVFKPQMKQVTPALPPGVVKTSLAVVVPHVATASFTPGAAGVYRLQVEGRGGAQPLSAELTVTD